MISHDTLVDLFPLQTRRAIEGIDRRESCQRGIGAAGSMSTCHPNIMCFNKQQSPKISMFIGGINFTNHSQMAGLWHCEKTTFFQFLVDYTAL